jgi:RNA:NAD 2'-phosphotransferase (TPT1/KptA family)
MTRLLLVLLTLLFSLSSPALGRYSDFGCWGIAANSGGKLYHYTGEANVAGILEKGLVPGRASGKVWTSPNGSLTPTQAQIELALSPNRGLPGAMLEIDAAALQRAGIKPSLGPVRVQPTSNAPGGGLETIFDQAIPPEFIRRAC